MSEVTTELRRMLDERGADYRVSATGYSIDIGPYTTVYANRSDTTLDVSMRNLTPQQAIDAMLGRGTCYPADEYLDSYSDLTVTVCSGCGVPVDDLAEMNYCPYCGREVMGE